jgi:aminopeptidase N
VLVLRGGPLASERRATVPPVRPDEYDDPGSLFAASAYTVAAEIVRMTETAAGSEAFQRKIETFFDKFDGKAVTWEDFLAAIAPEGKAAVFQRWCDAPGLPTLRAEAERREGRFRIVVTQQAEGGPRPIPLRIALFDRDYGAKIDERLVLIEAESQAIDFAVACPAPAVSINRGFSAPVVLSFERTAEELAWLAARDDDPFARWDAMQALMTKAVFEEAEAALVIEAVAAALGGAQHDPAFLALLTALPHETILAGTMRPLDPQPIMVGLGRLRREIGSALSEGWRRIQTAPAADKGGRALRNLALDYLVAADAPDAGTLALAQLRCGPTMTEQDGALRALAHSDLPERAVGLADFHARWKASPAALDKWFAAQALSRRASAIEEARRLLAHPDFALSRAARMGALFGGVGANFAALHHPAGLGYRFLADAALALDRYSSEAASRILAPLLHAPPLEPRRAALRAAELQRLRGAPNLSSLLAAQVSAIS